MTWGPKQVFSTTSGIGSAASTSSYIDLGDKTYSKMAVKYPTSMSTGAALAVYGCDTSTGTFLPVYERVNTAPVQYQALVVATNTSGGWAVFDAPPFRYVQFCASATVTDGGGIIKLIVQD